MAPFYGWGSTASRLQPLRGGSLYHSNVQPNVQRYAFVYVNTVHLRGGMHTMGKVEGWRILRNEGILVIMQGFLY